MRCLLIGGWAPWRKRNVFLATALIKAAGATDCPASANSQEIDSREKVQREKLR
jgi:hypothetical protein